MNIESNNESAKERMMAYLYDELSAAEKKAFEKELENNQALRNEVEAFKDTRSLLGKAGNESVTPPPFFQLMDERKQSSGNNAFKWVGSIAASLLILLFAAKLSGLSVKVENGNTSIAFNSSADLNGSYIPKAEVNQMIETSLVAYDQKINQQLDNRDQKQEHMLNAQFAENRTAMANSLNKIEKKNEQLMANYWQKNTAQQKQYMTSLMGDFTNYVEQRRSEDMQYLIAKINLLETDTDLLELETNQLKSSYAVNNTEDAY
jgi:hypothetical protein